MQYEIAQVFTPRHLQQHQEVFVEKYNTYSIKVLFLTFLILFILIHLGNSDGQYSRIPYNPNDISFYEHKVNGKLISRKNVLVCTYLLINQFILTNFQANWSASQPFQPEPDGQHCHQMESNMDTTENDTKKKNGRE